MRVDITISQPKRLVLTVLILIFALPLRAEFIWTVKDSVPSHAKPDDKSKTMFPLKAGSQVRVLGKTKNGWLKIKNPKKPSEEAYTPVATLVPPVKARGKSKGLITNNMAGFVLVYSVLNQAGRVFKDSNPSVDISSLTGSTLYFGAFFDLPITGTWKGRIGAQMRKLSLKGTTQVLSTTPTAPSSLEVEQDFFGVRGMALRYLSPRFWFGVGGEIAQAMKSTVKTTNTADQPEKPLYGLIQLASGYDFVLSGFVIEPEFRLGSVINSTPMMWNAEFAINLGYIF